ncbi:hypothetical protein ACFVKB_34375 [Rhodococcus sp. NPDC127530]|uniref:hypothetical protein n=1 Tax=unclassified Rhodococcus (in: high G+C Gram-positive bacteria) TaxID=192944 RepID=UPI003629F653
MPPVPYHLHAFPSSLGIPTAGTLIVRQVDLMRAAATIGVTPFGRSAHRYPASIDLLWRAAMAQANLQERHTHWERSDSYCRMNPTEKGAVSYFLGQVQAKLAAEQIFGIATFAHFESYLEAIGQRSNQSRPDFIGFNNRGNTFVTVEAKGRFGKHPADRYVQAAKKQAQTVSSSRSSGTDHVYAQVAHFESGVWTADLHDPPSVRQTNGPDPSAVTFAHYWPTVAAINERRRLLETSLDLSDAQELEGTRSALFPEVGFALGVPEDIADSVTVAAQSALASKHLDRQQRFPDLLDATSIDAEEAHARRTDDPRVSVGNDGIVCVLLRPGNSG